MSFLSSGVIDETISFIAVEARSYRS